MTAAKVWLNSRCLDSPVLVASRRKDEGFGGKYHFNLFLSSAGMPHQAGPKARCDFRTARADPNPIPATKSPANRSPAMPAVPMIR